MGEKYFSLLKRLGRRGLATLEKTDTPDFKYMYKVAGCAMSRPRAEVPN
jgi:hypothetical protein